MSEPSQFLYRLRPSRIGMLSEGPTPHESDVVSKHFGYLQQFAAAGIVLMAGRTLEPAEEVFGIVVFTAESDAAALDFMRNDPAVKQGVMLAELFPFRVALWSGKA